MNGDRLLDSSIGKLGIKKTLLTETVDLKPLMLQHVYCKYFYISILGMHALILNIMLAFHKAKFLLKIKNKYKYFPKPLE